MPTCNRRVFVPQAIGYFLRQDYEPKELIVVDDGTDPIGDVIPADERIRYVRLDKRLTVGAKRNLACGEARGDIIVHWDDDDWMADWRLRYQVGKLRMEQADICGLRTVLFFDPHAGAAWEYVFPGTIRPWVYGATLCYSRSFWKNNPFRNIGVGEDSRFVWNDPGAKIAALAENRFMAALIHPGNTGAKRVNDDCWVEYPIAGIRKLIGNDWGFYAREKRF
jgi:glycosyltransferase involved in cell wall biosynthesis